MDNAELARWLEFGMLFCFGFSWPFAIARTIKAERVDGKSPLFSTLVIIGYFLGIAAHVISDKSWVIWVYLTDTVLVSIDFVIYFYKRNRQNRLMTK